MDQDYDLFEQMSDGTLLWRCHVAGLHDAQEKLQEIAKATNNECLAMHLATKKVVARTNGSC